MERLFVYQMDYCRVQRSPRLPPIAHVWNGVGNLSSHYRHHSRVPPGPVIWMFGRLNAQPLTVDGWAAGCPIPQHKLEPVLCMFSQTGV